MRFFLLIPLFLASNLLFSQVDYGEIVPDYGAFSVGFRHVQLVDSSRAYARIQDFGEPSDRPVSVSIWEPAAAVSKQLSIRDYLNVLKVEEEWPALPFDYFFDWFYIPGTPHNVRQAAYPTRAHFNYDVIKTDKPILIYSASFRASSTENFILGEYLASHGYTVLAIPSKGHHAINFEGGTLREATAQSDDLAFVLENLEAITNQRAADVYLSGFSFGGLSHILNVFHHRNIKGVISLDGAIKYQPAVVEASVDYDLNRFRVPFIHFSQKDIPAEILEEEGNDPSINTDFRFYDALTVSQKYQVKATRLSHTFFAAYGLLFNEREPRQDPDYRVITESYVALLSNVKASLEHFSSKASDVGAFTEKLSHSGHFNLVDYQIQAPSLSFKEFIALTDLNDLSSIERVHDSLKVIDASFQVPEGHLNVLGLQLIFTPATFDQGVNVFQYALSLYPNSGNLHDSLAEGYRYHGQKSLARKHFLKSLELSPGNQNARRRLKELE